MPLLSRDVKQVKAAAVTSDIKKAPSSFEGGAPKNLQFLYYAFITFPLCVPNISIANSYVLTLPHLDPYGT